MCGICGIINFDKVPAQKAELDIMLSYLKRRGPDYTGTFLNQYIALGHQRLSIIDLTASANQPMKDEGRIIVFNGEIYNFPELKKELASQISFNTSSDTEVLLKGYRVWGFEKLLEKINGMFAFGILDQQTGELWLARDRFGEKPLYYLINDNKVKFASELNSIYYTEEKLSLNQSALDYYFSELAMPQPETIWNEVKQLEAAHFIKVDLNSGRMQIKKYWDFKQWPPDSKASEEEILQETERLLLQSMKARTISDVPFACFLSGGIDSGLIVSMLSAHGSKKLKTFTIGYDIAGQNEAPLAKKLADKYLTDHTEIILQPEVVGALSSLVDYIGEPFADPSIIPTFYVCKSISSHVKMAISGDGGDEMFGGYFEFEFASKADQWLQKHPNKWMRNTKTLLGKVAHKLNWSSHNPGHINAFINQHPSLFLYRQKGFHPFEKNHLYHDSYDYKPYAAQTIARLEQNWKTSRKNTISDSFFTGSVYPRLNEYLVKVDRASMINSLEVRTPFLDRDLAEFIFRVPGSMKLKNNQTKYLLKKLAQKYMDPDIFERPKQGFGIPVDEWFRKELKEFMQDLLLSEKFKARKMFNQKYVESLITQHLESSADHTHRIWLLIVFELWCRKYLDKNA